MPDTGNKVGVVSAFVMTALQWETQHVKGEVMTQKGGTKLGTCFLQEEFKRGASSTPGQGQYLRTNMKLET